MNVRKAALRVVSICLKVAVFVMVILGIIYLGQTAYRYTHAIFSETAMEEPPGRNVTVKISEDVDGKQLAEVLESNGLIENAAVFQFQMKLAGVEDTVKAGSYELNTSMTPSEMFEVLFGQDEDDEA